MLTVKHFFAICRWYADRLGDRPADRLYQLLCVRYFHRLHGFIPRFHAPTTFTEAVWSKMLFDRDPHLKVLADKFTSREFIASRIGEHNLVPLLWKGDDPEQIPFSDLPSSYVLKASHGSGFNLIVNPSNAGDRETLMATTRSWLARDYCRTNGVGSEWAYRGLSPTIIIEPFLSDESGGSPPDFKLLCLNGSVRMIHVDLDRATNHTRSVHDRHFRRLDVRIEYPPPAGDVPKPDRLEEMIGLAEELASGFRILRVDFYCLPDRIVLGEITNYPGGGRDTITPRSFDRSLVVTLV